jgi:hypothetical protein
VDNPVKLVDERPNVVETLNRLPDAHGHPATTVEFRDFAPVVDSAGQAPSPALVRPRVSNRPKDPTSNLSERLLFRGYGLEDLD